MGATGITTAFWSMTINNYDDNDVVLVENGFPDYMRELVWQFEEGAEGTPHIQAWIKLQRQQRMSFVKKLFPRGHFKPITADEYIVNVKKYAQKTDDTKQSASVHRFNDPFHTIENLVKKVCERIYADYGSSMAELSDKRKWVEREMVMEDYKMAKIFVSSTYMSMWKKFGHEMYACIFDKCQAEHEKSCVEKGHTHTHTHTGEILSREDGINASISSGCRQGSRWEGEEDDENRFESSSTTESVSSYGEGSEEDCETSSSQSS